VLPHLALFDQVVKRAQRFLDRGFAVGLVYLIQIDPVGLQSFQARLTGRDRAVTAGVGRQNLGDQKHLVTAAPDGLAGDCFSAAIGQYSALQQSP